MDSLKPVMSRYVDIVRRLADLNAHTSELRDERRSAELDLAALYASAREDLPPKITLDKSQMIFVAKKPGEWKKGWSLSKKQLHEYLLEILPEHGEDVFREICQKHEPKLVEQDYGFELRPMSSST